MNQRTRQLIEFGLACVVGLCVLYVMAESQLIVKRAPYSVPWLIWLAGISPWLEELTFRGFIQGEIDNCLHWKIIEISFSNVVTSLLFAALHALLYKNVLLLFVIFPSLLFGYFRDRYKTLKLSIALHVLFNTGYFVLFGG